MSKTDTTATDAVDTSTNDEGADAEADLEESDVSFDNETDTEESSESEETDSTEDTDEESDESEEDGGDESSQDEETTGEESTADPATERKRHNAEMAEKRIAAREARQQQLTKDQQDHLEGAEDARDMAVRQLQIDAYNNRVQTNKDRLQNGLDKAVGTIDLLRDKNAPAEAREELANALDDFERMYVVKDRYGNPYEVKADVHEFLSKKAESIRRLAGIREAGRARDKANTKSRTDTLPSKTPKKAKVDADLEAFDEEAERD